MAGSATQRTALFSRQQVGGAWTIDDYQEHPGDLWFVDSTHGRAADTAGLGKDPDHPLATIHFANTQAADNNGDVIYVAPKHSEEIDAAGAITLDKQGLKVIGLGIGDDRPTLTWSDTVSTLAIDDCDILMKNFRFVQGIDAIDVMVDVNGDDITLEECEFVEAAAAQAVSFIDLDGGGANACDNFKMIRCRVIQQTAGADQVVDIAQVQDGVKIIDCVMDVDCENACVYSPAIHTNCVIAGNYLHNRQTGDHAVEFSAAATGFIINNRLAGDTSGDILDPGNCHCAGNIETTAINSPGYPTPVAIVDHEANILGANTADNDFASNLVARNPIGSIIERLEDVSADLSGGDGIAVFPAAAKADDAVSMAEVLRHADDSVEQCVAKLDGALLTGQDPLFDVAGGPILVTSLVGIVTTPIGGAAETMHIDHTSTTPGGDIPLSTTVAIGGDAAGHSYTFTDVALSVFTPTPAGTIPQLAQVRWLLPIGTLKSDGSAANTGVIAWYMTYKPLSPLCVVTAAA